MAPARWVAAWLLLLLLLGAAVSGCSDKPALPPQPRPQLEPVVSWLQRYYQKSPPALGWTVASIASQGSQVQVTVAIPANSASAIMRQPADDQFRLVAQQTCPGRGEAVWRLLPGDSSITILPSVAGQVFIEVRCGRD